MSDREIMNAKGFNNKPRKDFTEKAAGILAVIIISIILILSIFLTGCDNNIETTTTLELYPLGYASGIDWDMNGFNARYDGWAIVNETDTVDMATWCMSEGPFLPIGLPTVVYVNGSSPYYTTINSYDVMIIAQ